MTVYSKKDCSFCLSQDCQVYKEFTQNNRQNYVRRRVGGAERRNFPLAHRLILPSTPLSMYTAVRVLVVVLALLSLAYAKKHADKRIMMELSRAEHVRFPPLIILYLT